MDDIEIKKNYERSIQLNDVLFSFLKKELSAETKMRYDLSYEVYSKISEFNHNSIDLELPKYKSASVSVHSYSIDRDLPFWLSLWKYKGGDSHESMKIDFMDSMDDENFCLWALDYINDFFGFEKKESFKQMSIFDFV